MTGTQPRRSTRRQVNRACAYVSIKTRHICFASSHHVLCILQYTWLLKCLQLPVIYADKTNCCLRALRHEQDHTMEVACLKDDDIPFFRNVGQHTQRHDVTSRNNSGPVYPATRRHIPEELRASIPSDTTSHPGRTPS